MARSENKETAGSTTRYIATMARRLRVRKNWTQEELGAKIGFTASAVSAMETCAQPASDQMLQALEEVLGDGLGIFEEAREFLRMDKYPRQFKDFALLEQKAVSLSSYETVLINGLFQTEEYARALMSGGYPPLAEKRVEELVEARMARKALFDRDPSAHLELVLDEAVLRKPFGTRASMRAQYLDLAESAQRRNVTLQVMLADRGLSAEHAGERGAMTLLETPEHDRLVYLEIQDESLLISDPAKVSTYAQRYAKIRSQALGPDESLGFIEKLAGEEQ